MGTTTTADPSTNDGERPMDDGSTMAAQTLAKMKEELEAEKILIKALPLMTNDDMLAVARRRRAVGKKEEEYEVLLESKRIADLVRAHEELHPPITEDCPICFEVVKITDMQSLGYCMSCGQGICAECVATAPLQNNEVTMIDGRECYLKFSSCPLCRADAPKEAEMPGLIKKLAERGAAFAQTRLGYEYLVGREGLPKDAGKAGHWFELATEQCFPPALYQLSKLYHLGLGVEKDETKSRMLLKEAADLGDIEAQWQYGAIGLQGEGGKMNESESAKYLSLACRGKNRRAELLYLIGEMFYRGSGMPESTYLAKHYLGEAAKKGYESAYLDYAKVFLDICDQEYSYSVVPVPLTGHNLMPNILFWARKASAVEKFKKEALVIVNASEELAKSMCANIVNCGVRADSFSGQFKACSVCKAAFYCSKKCQVEHWKSGHKIDCIKHK